MDSVSQIVLGASVGYLALGPVAGRRAVLIGAALGTLPDLDVLVPYDDAVASFTYHRSWSHSLLVLSIISVPIAWACQWLLRSTDIRYSRCLLGVWLVLITHPILDGFTIYGTQIWWPFDSKPTAWGSVFIIDPLYTLPLIVGGMLAWRWPWRRARTYVITGLVLSTVYLGWTLLAQQTTRQKLEATLAAQGTVAEQLLVAPFPFSLLWRVVVMTENHYLEGYSSLLDKHDIIELDQYDNGKSACNEWLTSWPVERLDWFTQGVYALSIQGQQLVASDLRMGIEDSYVFEFDVADWEDGEWQKITTRQRALNIDGDRMRLLLQRMFDESVNLTPLAPSVDTVSANCTPQSFNS